MSLFLLSITYMYSDEQLISINDVRKLLNHLNISITTLDQASEFAQKNLLRNGECWDIQEKKEWHALAHDKEVLLLNDLVSIGMIDAVQPKQNSIPMHFLWVP